MEKTRDFFKKIRDTKEIFHAKMGSIKDRNGMDQTGPQDPTQFIGRSSRNRQRTVHSRRQARESTADFLRLSA